MTREEAIKLIKQIKGARVYTEEEKKALETLIPELAESEDERIRKELIEAFEVYDIESSWNRIPVKRILTWLEKQKENQKSADSISSDCTSDAKCEDRWHKVGDSMPDNPREVLCKDEAGNYFIGRYYVGDGWEISNYDDEDKPHHLNPPVSKWIDFPSEKQKEQTWIPTDEQRTALGMVLKHSDPDADSTKVLESLLDELTKIANPKVAKWKEKQKEQKPVKKEITLTNFEETLNTFLFDFANSSIEDCEPKEYIKKHSAEILKAAYTELNAQLKQDIFEAKQEGRYEGYEAAKVEQKPAEWDDYTKINLARALQIIKNAKGKLQGYQSDDGIYECDKAIECLEHFLYRGLEIEKPNHNTLPIEQQMEAAMIAIRGGMPSKSQEWSDEDEERLKAICTYLQDYPRLAKINDVKRFNEYCDWLKSLRPQPHWKPSEEQLEAFRSYIKDFQEKAEAAVGGWNNFDVMIQLFEQLKKL